MWAWLVASQVRLFSAIIRFKLVSGKLYSYNYDQGLAISLPCIPYRTHLTGVINHDYGVSCYINRLTWTHDANLVINVLVDTILKKKTPSSAALAA